MHSEPRGYWTRVFDQAAALLRARPELNGDTAYWLARRLVDQTLMEQDGDAAPRPTVAASEALVLAP